MGDWRLSLGGAVLLFFAAVVLLPAAPVVVPLCSDNPEQIARARALVQQGLDHAVISHTEVLFRTWLSGGNLEDSGRAANGILNEMRGFLHAQKVVDALKVPPCRN